MKRQIKLMELFSGIGGFAKGFEKAGYHITEHTFSEIDKHAIANYQYQYPHAKSIGSVTTVRCGDIERPDVITFGSPCQDFSLAGKREGLDGSRSVLVLEAIRIIRDLRPSVFIWENVKGAFSSNRGADFWAIIAAFADIGGYRLEWQLLNTSWVLPQNRERIYLVGHATGRSQPGVFPIGENDCRADEGLSETAIIRTLTAGGHSGGHHSGMTLIKSNTKQGFETANIGDSINYSVPNSITRRARVGKGIAQTIDTQANQAVMQVKVGHVTRTEEAKDIRREAMKNGKDFTPFQGKDLQFLDSDVMNTITCATQKDNLIQVENQPFITNPKMNNYKPNYSASVAITSSSYKEPPCVNNIRRLTEIECERLQGFPDDWTKYGLYEKQVWINKKEKTFEIVKGVKEIPKTRRYKLIGNSATVDIVALVAARLLFLD